MLKKLSGYALALVGLTLLFSSCKKDYESVQSLDERNIETYLSENKIDAVKDSSGFYYQITSEGSGDAVANQDSVYYSFDFQHTNGTTIVKNSDYKVPSSLLGYTDHFTIGSVAYLITPVREVLSKLKRGGTAKVIIPSRMLFGRNGNSTVGVGSNEVIIVDLKLYTQTKQHEIDELEINKYVADSSLTVIKDPSRVRYVISEPGTGTIPITENSTLTVKYTGSLLDGTVFDSNTTGTSLELNALIKGWILALPGKITAGGKIRLIIPSDLGYGPLANTSGTVTIPASSCLNFTIEVTEVTN